MPEDTVHIRPTILYCIGRNTLEAVAVPTHKVAPSNTESSIVERVYRLRTETLTILIRMRPTSLKLAAVVAFVIVAGVVVAVLQQVAVPPLQVVRPLQVVHQPASPLIKSSLPHRLLATHPLRHHHQPAAHLLRHHHVRATQVTATHRRLVVLLHRLGHSHQGTYSTLEVLPTDQYR